MRAEEQRKIRVAIERACKDQKKLLSESEVPQTPSTATTKPTSQVDLRPPVSSSDNLSWMQMILGMLALFVSLVSNKIWSLVGLAAYMTVMLMYVYRQNINIIKKTVFSILVVAAFSSAGLVHWFSSDRQQQMSTPEIEIKASKNASGTAMLDFVVENQGASDIKGIEIYADLFSQVNIQPDRFIYLSHLGSDPDHKIPDVVRSGTQKPFTLDFRYLMPRIENAMLNRTKNGNTLIFLIKVKTSYHRNLDGKRFDDVTGFILAYDFKMLTALENRRGIESTYPINGPEILEQLKALRRLPSPFARPDR